MAKSSSEPQPPQVSQAVPSKTDAMPPPAAEPPKINGTAAVEPAPAKPAGHQVLQDVIAHLADLQSYLQGQRNLTPQWTGVPFQLPKPVADAMRVRAGHLGRAIKQLQTLLP